MPGFTLGSEFSSDPEGVHVRSSRRGSLPTPAARPTAWIFTVKAKTQKSNNNNNNDDTNEEGIVRSRGDYGGYPYSNHEAIARHEIVMTDMTDMTDMKKRGFSISRNPSSSTAVSNIRKYQP